jgi:hypothetical protein
MARRLGALLGILLIAGLLLLLVWGVYQHHQTMQQPDQDAATVVDALRVSSVVKFAPQFC